MHQAGLQNGGLPYRSHPLFRLRRATLITIFIGVLLDLLAIAVSSGVDYTTKFFVISIFLLLLSTIFILHDLITYAANKAAVPSAQAQNSEPTETTLQTPLAQEEPQWPSKRLIIIDFILAILFLWFFWITFFGIVNGYRRYYWGGGTETFESYANLANLAASIEHAIAFWKELMARKKAAWRRDLEATPCRQCGHVEQATAEEPAGHPHTAPRTDAGPSGISILERVNEHKFTLPKWAVTPNANQYKDKIVRDISIDGADATANEPLLVTPDGSTTEVGGLNTGYGTLDQSTGSISSVPETIVKKKDKGKRRVIDAE